MTNAPTIDEIRDQFPALQSGTVFLDNAGGSQLPRCVIDAVTRYMMCDYAQLGGDYPESKRAKATVNAAHEVVRVFTNTPRDGAVILSATTSQLCHVLAGAYAEALAAEPMRDQVVACTMGHEANVGPWMRLKSRGFEVVPWDVDLKQGTLTADSLRPLLSKRTRLVSFPHVSNLLGEVIDVAGITSLAHAFGAKVVVDGVAFAPHRAPDVAALGCDWYVYSTYKVFGPHMAALCGTRGAMDEVSGPNHFFIPKSEGAYTFELGGASHEGCAAICGLATYLRFLAGEREPAAMAGLPVMLERSTATAAMARGSEFERSVMEPLIAWLAKHPRVRMIGPSHAGDSRVSTISFVRPGMSSKAIATAANATGLAIRWGHFYSYRLVEQLGLSTDDGVVRVSLVHYNTLGEVERLIGWLEGVL